MRTKASDAARELALNAEAVCRYYLFNGRRAGRYWIVGDVRNTPGRSMFVRLKGSASGPGAAGKWTDAATGEHGDLLDIIRECRGLATFDEVIDEASRFLHLPHRSEPEPYRARTPTPTGSREAARRLFAMSQPVAGTLAETYLSHRGITRVHDASALRFHPRCYYRADEHVPTETWPAMIACVSDVEGHLTGVHRTWLDPAGRGKAPVETPRRAMGALLGHAVWFGTPHDVLAAGEGIETMLSLRYALPDMPMAAALSANHLSALLFPTNLRWLYVARDTDAAGDLAASTLSVRAENAGIATTVLSPRLGDFNEDLRTFGLEVLRSNLRSQLAPEHVLRFFEAVA